MQAKTTVNRERLQIGNMAVWVAITWENNRLLLLSASISGRSVTFEHADVLSDPNKLDELISRYRLAKAETIVVLNRSEVEVRSMVFPPVPRDELPDLVKFQAGKEFNHYEPGAPVDFFVTSKLDDVSQSSLFPAVRTSSSESASEGVPKHVLTSTLRIHTLQQIKTFCEGHNLVLRHIVLRPCATVALWRWSEKSPSHRSTLLIELDKNEVSQTVVFQGEPVFMRSPKIQRPQDVSTPDFCARLIAELKRTRVAVRNEIQGTDVDEIILCGSGTMFESLARQLGKGLELPVRLFDPLKGLTVKTEAANEQYAALLGAIQQVAQREPLHIDFCNPKKRAEDTSKRNLFTSIAATVFLIVVCLFGYTFYSRTVLKNEVDDLRNQLNELTVATKTVTDQKKQLDEIEKWLSNSVNWFEQLEWLSRTALSSQNMMIRGLDLSATGGGTIRFEALLRDQSLVASMEEGFRDQGHAVQTGQQAQESGNPLYNFKSSVTIRLSKDAAAAPPKPTAETPE